MMPNPDESNQQLESSHPFAKRKLLQLVMDKRDMLGLLPSNSVVDMASLSCDSSGSEVLVKSVVSSGTRNSSETGYTSLEISRSDLKEGKTVQSPKYISQISVRPPLSTKLSSKFKGYSKEKSDPITPPKSKKQSDGSSTSLLNLKLPSPVLKNKQSIVGITSSKGVRNKRLATASSRKKVLAKATLTLNDSSSFLVKKRKTLLGNRKLESFKLSVVDDKVRIFLKLRVHLELSLPQLILI